MPPRLFAFLSVLLTAWPALGTTVLVERDGTRVAEGEVCRFRATDPDNPFKRWLVSQDVTCAAASASLSFPPGLWNVFARSNGVVSGAPLLVDGDAAPPTVQLRLDAAATVTPLLPPGASGVVYAPKLGSAFPVPAGTERLLVPAGVALWLFVLEKGRPVAVVPIAALEPGAERRVDARSGGPSAVIGWLLMPERDRAALGDAYGISPPGIHAAVGGETPDSDVLPPLALLHGAFVRIPEVPAGDGELILQGRGWIPARRRLRVESALTVVGEPLTVRAAGTLVVAWSTADDLPALDRSLGSCDDRPVAALGEISVSSCAPGERPGEVADPTACTLLRQEPFDPEMDFGGFTVEGVAPGTYRAEMKFGKLPPVSGTATVAPFLQVRLGVLASYDEVHGSLTRGGEPLGEEAALTFPGGTGFATEEPGEYRAVLLHPLDKDAQITIAACDGAPRAIVLTDQPLRRRTRFDIDIPLNELTITVVDTFTHEPLGGATVRIDILSLSVPKRPVMSRTVTTGDGEDGAGRVVLTSLPERDIVLQVSLAGYEKQRIAPFSLTRSEKKEIEVQLVPLRGISGKIVSQRPFDSAVVVWFSSSGSETERADVAPDGTFIYAGAHEPTETMAVVSLSHPLWVLRSPPVARRETMIIRYPDTSPVREFDVWTAETNPRYSRHIGLVIGGVRVPQPVLRQHLTLRRMPATLRGGGQLHFRDILETGPIDVLLGPMTEEVSPRAGGMDLFALPQFSEVPRQRLGAGEGTVAFRVK